jgi:hypothetical protein
MVDVKSLVTTNFTCGFATGKGEVTILSAPETTSKAEANEILTSATTFQILGYTGGAINVAGSGQLIGFQFISSASKTQHEGKFVLLDGDKVEVTVSGNNVPAGAVTQPDVVTIYAKQNKVKGC